MNEYTDLLNVKMGVFARDNIAAATRKLFFNRENDEDADFTVVSKDEQIKVHSFIFKQASDELRTMISGNFQERKTRKIEFKEFSSETVASFIKFLYGFELNEGNEGLDLDTLKELMELGHMYNIPGLQDAAADNMKKFITNKNVLSLLNLSKRLESKLGKDNCTNYIVKNNSRDWLESSRYLAARYRRQEHDLDACHPQTN